MLNSFENIIVDVLLETAYFEFTGDKNTITPESCRKKIEEYSYPFLWSGDRATKNLLANTEVPSELVLAACQLAWSQLNWVAISESVRNQY